MKQNDIFLSLCIPTNGVIEWVVPVLESIYSSNCDNSSFEVIVTDNGNNREFYEKMQDFKIKHKNFIYKKTESVLFFNQIEAFKLANGHLIKFINHRMELLPGALDYLLKFARDNRFSRPVVYFSNGVLKLVPQSQKCTSFNRYIRLLKYWSSWSAGTAIWKIDFEKMDLSIDFNALFPHTDIIFYERNSDYYLVDDSPLLKEIPVDSKKKGKYDLFNAFAVEYPHIIEGLYLSGDITKETYKYVKKTNSYFVSQLYFDYVVRKKPCSYDLEGFSNACGKYYYKSELIFKTFIVGIKKINNRILKGLFYAKQKQ